MGEAFLRVADQIAAPADSELRTAMGCNRRSGPIVGRLPSTRQQTSTLRMSCALGCSFNHRH